MSWRAFGSGQHVIARRDIDGWLGSVSAPAVRKGTRGIVRAGPVGLLSNRLEVEFISGGRRWVRASDLRPALTGHGEEAFRRRQQTRQGIQLGLFVVFGLPVVIALTRFYLGGGNTADLIAAMPAAILGAVTDVVATLGFGITALLLGLLWLRHRTRH